MSAPATIYTCTRITCDWVGTDPMVCEDNLEAEFGEDGRLREAIRHVLGCPKCGANVKISTPTDFSRRQAS